ncbi:MAG: restriction endonuclease subunit S [Candidatus Electrothrix scaldis]|nr:MAG: restriction endonuclease subunit S [Candidatus Electrothrix sp. GW3-3]
MNIEQLTSEHLAVWTGAQVAKAAGGRGRGKKNEDVQSYGIKKLRELILELAVRGKLVPQDSADEPAAVLLERIAAEKARLVKEGKIKRQKKLPEISEEEKPFGLPEGWEWVRLQQIIQVSSGDNLTAANMNSDGEIPVFGGNGITGYHDKANVTKQTLVIGRVGYYCGSVHITPDVAWVTDNAFKTTYPEDNIYLHFLYWLLNGTNLKEHENATAQPVISGRKIYPIVIGLPPLSEQHRIVAKVDELMALCDRLEQQQSDSAATHQALIATLLDALTNSADHTEFAATWQRIAENFEILFTTEQSIDQLKQTILQLAVMGKLVPQNPEDEPAAVLLEKIAAEKTRLIKEGQIKRQKKLPEITEEEKPFALPSGWEWARFDSLSLHSEAGWSPKCESAPRVGNNWGVLKVSAVTWGNYNPDENKALPDNLEPKPEYEVKPRDFLISRANTAQLVARSVVVPDDAPAQLMMSDKIIRFVFSSKVDVEFINRVNSSSFCRDYYARIAGGTSSSMKNVSRVNIRNLPIPLPPLPEQHRIVTKVDELLTLCDTLKSRLHKARSTQVQLADALVAQVVDA